MAVRPGDAGSATVSMMAAVRGTFRPPAEPWSALAVQVEQDPEGNVVLDCPHVEPGCLYPEEVSAVVLDQLLQDAHNHTGASITKAVITVPAYFNDEQREATVAAGGWLPQLQQIMIICQLLAAVATSAG